jgi:hypothetical protein
VQNIARSTFCDHFLSNPLSQRDPLRLIACISKESDRKMSIERHFALNENPPLWCARTYNFVTTGVKLKKLIQ